MSDFQARVIVASNRASAGIYPDTSGPALVDGLRALGARVGDPVVVADGDPVEQALRSAVAADCDLVITSGGTGVSPADRTPEMTRRVLDYEIPGIAEAVRAYGAPKVPAAALSRGTAGVAGRTLVVNLAGSRGAATDGLAVLGPILMHALDQLRGGDHPGGGGQPTAAPTHEPTAPLPVGAGSHNGRLVKPDWDTARSAAHAAGSTGPEPVLLPLSDVDGATLAAPLRTRTALPAFPTSSVDGFAVCGSGPWQLAGRILAGQGAAPMRAGTAVEIATGAMVPAGAEFVIRLEDSIRNGDGTVTGTPRNRPSPEWRLPGEEAGAEEELLPAGTPVTPGVIGVAAQCGHDALLVRRPPRATLLVFGDELATSGVPGNGRVRDSLGPQLPGWLNRIGARYVAGGPSAPVADTLEAHVAAIRSAAAGAELICTTGGTMRGPVDHLHPALAQLGAEYIVDTVAVRPGYPMLLAKLPGGRFLAGLPGNPQSAVIALLSLVWPLVAGMSGRELPGMQLVRLGAEVSGRGDDTHLVLARIERDGCAYPLSHNGSSMLRGVARADGFVIVRPGGTGQVGAMVELLPFPLRAGERP